MMTCQATIRSICDYLDGRLSAVMEREVSMHLTGCPNCLQVLEVAEQTLSVYFDTDPLSLPHPQAN